MNLVLFIILLSACSSVSKIPASGSFHHHQIQTTVDHSLAKYYLENYLTKNETDPKAHAKIHQIHSSLHNDIPSRDQLKMVSEETESLDLGALLFANQLMKQKDNNQLQKDFLDNLEQVKNGTAKYPKKDDILIMLIPGFDYAENGAYTGADFAVPRKLLKKAGYRVHFIDINPLGDVEENATYIVKTISQFPDKDILIGGASSAGPAIHLALGEM